MTSSGPAEIGLRQPWPEKLRDANFWADRAVALVALFAAFAATSPVFLTRGNIEALLLASAILMVLAVGQTIVIVTAGIDLSIGAVTQLASVMLGWSLARGWGVGAAIAVAVLTGVVVGAANGVIVAKGRITDFIVTLGSLSVATGLALLASNGRPRPVSEPVLLELATGAIGPVRHMVLVALVVAVIGHVVLYHTGSGTHLLAVGGNREAARNMGVRVERVKIAAYAASGLTAGIAGVLLTARLGAAEPAAGTSYLLNSIAAVVLGGVSLFGGRGTVFGPVVGALVLTTLLNGLTLLGVAVFYQPVAVGVVVILSAVLTRWRGR